MNISLMRLFWLVWCVITLFGTFSCSTKEQAGHVVNLKYSPREAEMKAYLMVYFKDDDHSLHMALSNDGYRFTEDRKSVV